MTDFDPDWPHGHVHSTTGAKMRLVCRDARGIQPFIWLIEDETGEKEFTDWGERDGSLSFNKGRAINAPAPKRKLEAWVVFFKSGSSGTYDSKEDADSYRSLSAACIHVTCDEGDGL